MQRFSKMFNKLIALGVLTVIFPIAGEAQVTEAAAIEAVRSSRCVASTSPPEPLLLRVTRTEDLEDEIFGLRARDPAPLLKPVYLFEVHTTGTFIVDNKVIIVTSTVMDKKLIAVSSGGEVFPLFGCGEEKSLEFQKLIKDSKINIRSVGEAESFGLLYYKLTEDPELSRMVYHPWEIRHRVEDFFLLNSEGKAEAKFDRWMKTFVKSKLPQDLGVSAISSGQRYVVRLYFMEYSLHQTPRLKREELNLGRDGSFEITSSIYLL